MLEKRVKAEARKLGFELAGITTPDPPPHFGVFERWLESGRHGDMDYLATQRSLQRRSDPRRILPECKSILVLGVRYANPESIPLPGPAQSPRQGEPNAGYQPSPWEGSTTEDRPVPHGRVASYAWGDDYHHVLLPRLQALVDYIQTQVGRSIPNRFYTDTGPLLERDLAQRAGMGWIGKNTCLINPRSGSYFFLAEILLGLELTPDIPFKSDHCGTCRRCLEVCPTQCILPDRAIDASRCISYLTIELKTAIPLDLRRALGNWVFGCDLCQQVCPWNIRFAAQPASPTTPIDEHFAPRPAALSPDLHQDLTLTPEQFNRKFKGSPLKRAKRRGYLRNVAVALGNLANPASTPVLSRALLSDAEPLVRAHSAWALGEIGTSAAHQVLTQAMQVEADKAVLAEIHRALSKVTKG